MDSNADFRTLSTHTSVEGEAGKPELSLPYTHCAGESEGTILLQLLEFKTHLLEAVEELHIRRDAETRFEDQLSKLVLEKQELEWEKESLQQQIETLADQNKESLSNVKKQFQAKIRNAEEEKWKYQLSAELKDKEVINLKEELKTLQLLKYNLEKKSSELEQKLALQSRSKDSHLNQLGKVEKRFTALSRQCATIKQAHVKLEQNVNEAMSINRKLSSANEKQEATIVSLKKELEEVNKQLIKARMTSVTLDKIHSSTGKDQHIQQLQQKLNTETEINKKLCKENKAVRTEKQEVIKALQHAEHLLLSQTQTVSRVDLELQTQKEWYQALKQEHEMMREKSKALEDKVAQLMESYAASKTSWDKEKTVFLGHIKKEQEDLQAAKEAYNALYQKHIELSSLHQAQTDIVSSQVLSVSTQVFPSLLEKAPNKPIPTSELCVPGSLQRVTPSLTKGPDCHDDTGAVTGLLTTGPSGGATESNQDQRIVCRSVDLVSRDKYESGNIEMNEKVITSQDGCKQEKERNSKQQWDRVTLLRDVHGERRDMPVTQTGDKGSAEDAVDTKNSETETRDRVEREAIDEVKERGKTATRTSETPETQIQGQTTADKTITKSNQQQVVDFMDTAPAQTVSEASDVSQGISLKVIGTNFSNSNKELGDRREEQWLPSFHSVDSESVNTGPSSVSQEVQNLCCFEDETQDANSYHSPNLIFQLAEKMTTEVKLCKKSAADLTTECSDTLNESSICCTQKDTAPLGTQTDAVVSIQEAENPSGFNSNTEQTDDTYEINVTEGVRLVKSQSLPSSEQETGKQECLVTDSDANSSTKNGCHPYIVIQENSICQSVEDPMSGNLDACADEVKSSSFQAHLNVKIGETKDVHMTTESKLKRNNETSEAGCSDCHCSAKQMLGNNTDESFLHSRENYSSSFNWGNAQGRAAASRVLSNVSTLQPLFEGAGLNETGSSRNHRHPLTIPMLLRSKHNKVPLVMTRASELLTASSVSGTAASTVKCPQGECKALGGTCGDTAVADTESRTSLSFLSSSIASKLSGQATLGSSKGPASATGFVSEEPSCSQETEDQQSLFRAQMSKIEQFLNRERLCLRKSHKTDK